MIYFVHDYLFLCWCILIFIYIPWWHSKDFCKVFILFSFLISILGSMYFCFTFITELVSPSDILVCFSLQSKVFDLDFCSHILADVFWKIYNIFFCFQKLWLVCSYLRLFWILCSEFAWFFSPYSLNGYYFIGTNLSFSTSGFFFFLEILIVGLFLFDYWNDGFLWSVLIWLFEWCWS